MTIWRDKLDDREKGILDELDSLVPIVENMYEDVEICLIGKDQEPLLKRCKAKRNLAREMRDGFLNYLVINGKASRN